MLAQRHFGSNIFHLPHLFSAVITFTRLCTSPNPVCPSACPACAPLLFCRLPAAIFFNVRHHTSHHGLRRASPQSVQLLQH